VLYILFAASVIMVGVAGAMVSYREGRYLPLGSQRQARAGSVEGVPETVAGPAAT
jgi:hypothetical protein